LLSTLKEKSKQFNLLCFNIGALSGNLYSAFRSAQWVKKHHPEIKVSMGGGFPNTELRSLSDARVLNFSITLL
jgi:hypothetical protein